MSHVFRKPWNHAQYIELKKRRKGLVSGTTTVSGDGYLDGYTDAVLITSGSISGLGELEGLSTGQLTISSNLLGLGELAGSIANQLIISSDLNGLGNLTGNIAPQIISSGILTGIAELEGASSSQLSTTSLLDGAGELNSTITLQLTTSADGDSIRFGEANSDSQLSVSSVLGGTGELEGSATNQLTTSTSLIGIGGLEGLSTLILITDGYLESSAFIEGISLSELIPAATLSGTGQLSGAISLNLSDSGTIAGLGALNGMTTLQLATTADGDSIRFGQGDISLQSSVSGTLLGIGELDGTSNLQLSENTSIFGLGELGSSLILTLSAEGTGSSFAQISGDTNLQLSTSSALVGTGELEGSSALILSTDIIPNIFGSANLILNSNSVLDGIGELDGYAQTQLSTSGLVTSDSFIDGYILLQLDSGGELLGDGELAGLLQQSLLINSQLSGDIEASGSAAMALDVTGVLSGVNDISGDVTQSITTNGMLLGDGYLESLEDPTLTVTGTLVGDGYLEGSVFPIISNSANLFGDVAASADITFSLTALALLAGAGELNSSVAFSLLTSAVLSGSLGGQSTAELTTIGTLLGAGVLEGNSISILTASSFFTGPIDGYANLNLSSSSTLSGLANIIGNTYNLYLTTNADLSIDIDDPVCATLSGAGNASSVGHLVRHDLNYINHIVQNTLLAYPKEIIISVLRDEFSKDSYYHYVSDEFGFPKVLNHRNLSLGAGYDDDDVTRIFIGEAYRHDVIMYPSILVKAGAQRYAPISFNRNKETVQYEAIKIVDGYGNETVTTVPKAFVLQGAWEGSVNVEITTRDILSRDDIVGFCSLLFVDVRFEELLKAGILIKGISESSPTEDMDRNQERLYKQTITLEIRTEWRREIPICDLVDFINICMDFGRIEGVFQPVIAPNLTINTTSELLDEINNINIYSNAPWEDENLMGVSRSSILSNGSLSGNINISGTSTSQALVSGTILVLYEEDSLFVSTETDWYIDPISGDDGYLGTSPSQAFATMAELTKRIGLALIPQGTNIHILNDIPADDYFIYRGGLIDDGYIAIKGENPTTLASGTFSSVTNLVSESVRPRVTWSGGDWTPYINKRVRIVSTSGSTQLNTIFYIEEVVSGDVQSAYISTPYYVNTASTLESNFSARALTNGDGFIVEDLTKIGNVVLDPVTAQSTPFVRMAILNTDSSIGSASAGSLHIGNIASRTLIYGNILPYTYYRTFGYCYFTANLFNGNFGSTLIAQGGSSFIASSFRTACNIYVSNRVDVLTESSFNNSINVFAGLLNIDHLGGLGGARINNWPSGAAITLHPGASVDLDSIVWGSSAASGTYAFDLQPGTTVTYNSARKPTITGALAGSKDVEVGGLGAIWADVPIINNLNGAAIVERT